MMKTLGICLLSLLLCGSCCQDKPDTPPKINEITDKGYTVYYVDSQNGNDGNDGLSEAKAWKSLAKVTESDKHAGMKILFKSGCTFKGELKFSNLNSTEEKPFLVGIYGGTKRAKIDGQGVHDAVYINDDNIRIHDLHITNKNGKRGIFVEALHSGAMKNIEISGCRLEEINWAGRQKIEGVHPDQLDVCAIAPEFGKDFGGIVVAAFTSKETGPSWYENLFITNNELYKVSRTGILLTTLWASRVPGHGYNNYDNARENWYPNLNVVVQGNRLEYIGGDGTILIGCKGAFIDHNTCYYANFLGRHGQASAGLWPYVSENTTMQYNEVAYTQWANGSADGEGMDIDHGCIGTKVQYNYIHHNVGGGILMCNLKDTEHGGSVIRNNVFALNGGSIKGSFMVVSSAVGQTEVRNNLVIVNEEDKNIIYSDDWAQAGPSCGFLYKDNIFLSVFPTEAGFDFSDIADFRFEHNLYFQVGKNPVEDPQAAYDDPMIRLPENFDGYDKFETFKPKNKKVRREGFGPFK